MRSPATSKHATLGLLRPNVACLDRSEEHTSELQSRSDLVCRLLLEKKKKKKECPGMHKEKKTLVVSKEVGQMNETTSQCVAATVVDIAFIYGQYRERHLVQVL